MTTKLKLTDEPNHIHWLSDEAIADMGDALVDGGVWMHRAYDFCSVVRALRDRAKAVMEICNRKDRVSLYEEADSEERAAFDALNEILPGVKHDLSRSS